MVILGVNGWPKRSHDGSACIIENGRLKVFLEQERVSRRRYAFEELPHDAIEVCLANAHLTADDIDIIAVGWDYWRKYIDRNITIPPVATDLVETYLPNRRFSRRGRPELVIVPHHLAHASMAYHSAGGGDAAILVLDGQGEDDAISVWHGREGQLQQVLRFSVAESLGYFFEAVSAHIGFDLLGGGKTMGLAAYGSAKYDFPELALSAQGVQASFRHQISHRDDSTDEQKQTIAQWRKVLQRQFGGFESKGDLAQLLPRADRSDVAAAAQSKLEATIVHLAKLAHARTGAEKICLAGGVSLNCSANSRLRAEAPFREVSIFPTVNDGGVSLGAAFSISFERQPNLKIPQLCTAYLGPAYSDDEILMGFASVVDRGLRSRRINLPEKEAAERIAQGQIVAWFQGRAEAGPRALGNRSILADPRSIKHRDRVNMIKNREPWRPLAPSILAEFQNEFFVEDFVSPFMLFTMTVRPSQRVRVPAITHVDGTTRPQTVTKNDNPAFWRLIDHFHNLTGIPMVINTSFNTGGEPLVLTPKDAILTFRVSELDALFIGSHVIEHA